MIGNPFLRAFKWIDLELGTESFIPFNTQTEYHQTGYVHDSTQLGQPCKAITATGRTLGIPFEC